jgi:hypothetical protein
MRIVRTCKEGAAEKAKMKAGSFADPVKIAAKLEGHR